MPSARRPLGDPPRGPAKSFWAVHRNLPTAYYDHRPPSRGVRLEVVAVDGSISCWDFTAQLAGRMQILLEADKDVRSYCAVTYADPDAHPDSEDIIP